MHRAQPSELPDAADLDPSQRAAVEHRSPVVRVLGGPGTGKTTVVAHTVLDRVRSGEARPDRCLVLTPGRLGAAALRESLTAALGATTTEPLVRTHQALGFGLLRRQAAIERLPSPTLLSGPEQDVILRELLAGHAAGLGRVPDWPAHLAEATRTRGFRAELRDLLMRAVEYGLDGDGLAELAREVDAPVWAAAAEVLAEYDEVTALSRPGGYDPAWILTAATAMLEADPQALEAVQQQVDVIVVEDAQELTAPAHRLLRVLAGPSTDLVLVGDPDVATQTFRGADPRLFLGYWPGAREEPLLLARSWRLPPALIEVYARVAAHIGALGAGAHRRLEPAVPHQHCAPPDEPADDPRAQVQVALSAAAEAQLVAATLRRAHLLDGLPYSQMALIVRGAARTATMRRVLAAQSVPVAIQGARVPLRDEPAVRPLLYLFETVLALAQDQPSPLTPEVALDILTSPVGGTDSLGVRRLRRALRRAAPAGDVRSSEQLLGDALLGDEILDDIGPEGAPARRVRAAVSAGRAVALRDDDGWRPGVTAETVLWQVWSASDLAESWAQTALAGGTLGPRADRDLDAVVALMGAAATYVDRLPMRGPDGFLEHIRGQDVAGDTLVPRAPSEHCVTLTTPAGAAGSQWDLVVVAGVQEGVWPDTRLRGTVLGSATLVDLVTERGTSARAARTAVRHDETRLFLTAISRARQRLVVTAVRNEDEQPSVFLDLVDPAHAEERGLAAVHRPMTLTGMVAALRRELVTTSDESVARGAARRLARLARAGVPGSDPRQWWPLREVSDTRARRDPGATIAVSPSKVEQFAQCELRWMLTSAGGQSARAGSASAIGTLVHDIAAAVDNADFAAMCAALDQRWADLGLPTGWLSTRAHDQAAAMLGRLHRHHLEAAEAGWEVVGTEVDLDVDLGSATVRGRVDRLERGPDGRVRVIDLKTGSSKPTKAELAHLPQLGAYQVAIEQGAFADYGQRSAGAALLQLGKAGGLRGSLQPQPPLAEDEDPQWARNLLAATAEGMGRGEFAARVDSWCHTCDVRSSCPATPEGERLR